MANRISNDPRIDPRIKALFGGMTLATGRAPRPNATRDDLVAAANSAEAVQSRQALTAAAVLDLPRRGRSSSDRSIAPAGHACFTARR